jgi:hypothetical protein
VGYVLLVNEKLSASIDISECFGRTINDKLNEIDLGFDVSCNRLEALNLGL